jgi:hypothetical protein
MEGLRLALIDIIEDRLDETDAIALARPDNQFYFVTSKLVVFDTHRRLQDPRELVAALPEMSIGSIFYHFIDARRRNPESLDDFRAWLAGYGTLYEDLCGQLAVVDPFFPTLTELRGQLAAIFEAYFVGTKS